VLTSRTSEVAPSYVIDIAVDVVDRLEGPVHVHHGTRQAVARIVPLGERFHQLRLRRPLLALRGDRLVIRSIAPAHTIVGGTVLDPCARRHGASSAALARLCALQRGEDTNADAASTGSVEPPVPQPAMLELTPEVLATERRLRAAGHEPLPDMSYDAASVRALQVHGRASRIAPGLHIHSDALAKVERCVREIARSDGHVTVARLRDELRTSRRYALMLLAHFDRERVTVRQPDDTRILRPSRQSGRDKDPA
jgi:selenocysteine-specific elongation factor